MSFVASPSLMTVTGAGQAHAGPARRTRVLDTLGVPARLGRMFGTSEEAPGADAVLIVSHEAWQQHVGGRLPATSRKVPAMDDGAGVERAMFA